MPALLLASGAKGNRAALRSLTIVMKQPIARFQGQATDADLARKEIKNVKAELVALYANHIGKSPKQIEEDIRRPKYFSPSEAVEYGISTRCCIMKGPKKTEVLSQTSKGLRLFDSLIRTDCLHGLELSSSSSKCPLDFTFTHDFA